MATQIYAELSKLKCIPEIKEASDLIVMKKVIHKVDNNEIGQVLVDYTKSAAALKKYLESPKGKDLIALKPKILHPLLLMWFNNKRDMFPGDFWLYVIKFMRKLVFIAACIDKMTGTTFDNKVYFNIEHIMLKIEEMNKYWLNKKLIQKQVVDDPILSDLRKFIDKLHF